MIKMNKTKAKNLIQSIKTVIKMERMWKYFKIKDIKIRYFHIKPSKVNHL